MRLWSRGAAVEQGCGYEAGVRLWSRGAAVEQGCGCGAGVRLWSRGAAVEQGCGGEQAAFTKYCSQASVEGKLN